MVMLTSPTRTYLLTQHPLPPYSLLQKLLPPCPGWHRRPRRWPGGPAYGLPRDRRKSEWWR
eukprot:8190597-Alexandrium_andersonii.AAC.1